MLRLARRSGCRLLSFGIESTSDPARACEHDKEWNRPGRYREAVRTIKRHGIDVSTEMIIGMDGDDEAVFQRTYDFIMAERDLGSARPHPHSCAGHAAARADARAGADAAARSSAGTAAAQVVFRPRRPRPSALQEGYWKLYERLFSWRASCTASHRIAQRWGRTCARLVTASTCTTGATSIVASRLVSCLKSQPPSED
jgi:hypothetical protein